MGFEGLKCHGLVTIVVEPYTVEVIAPLVDRQITAPIVGYSLKLNEPSGFKTRDAIGPAADWRF